MLFAGHLSTSNYLFMDGHVKALKPLATISSSQGGTGSVNMWYIDGTNFSSSYTATVMKHLSDPGPFGY
jgi:prepilin-type processing-associated H-X9-DG protein